MQQCIKIVLFLILNYARHDSGDSPPHHQEPKTAQVASGFAYYHGRLSDVQLLDGRQVALPDNVQQLHVAVLGS
jgi:hypothetical protein